MAIKDFGLRVSLTVTKPQLTAKDDKATNDAEAANDAHNAGQYRKDLYPKHLISPINEVEAAARRYIAFNTLDSVLPTAQFMAFTDAMNAFEIQFNQAITVFMQNYSTIMVQAQTQQGGLFDPTLYPDTASLRHRFTWEVKYYPIADTSAFAHLIAPMEEAAQRMLTRAITKQVQAEAEAITTHTATRLRKVVNDLAAALARPDRTCINKKTGGVDVRPPIFKEALTDNITELTTVLEGFVDDLPPEVGALIHKASELTERHVTALRDDPDLRKATKDKATALLAEIDDLMGYSPLSITIPDEEPAATVEAVVEVAEEPGTVTPTVTPMPTPSQKPVGDLSDLFAALENYGEN